MNVKFDFRRQIKPTVLVILPIGILSMVLSACGATSPDNVNQRSASIDRDDSEEQNEQSATGSDIIAAKSTPVFLTDIKPVFDRYCKSCHNETTALGGITLAYQEFTDDAAAGEATFSLVQGAIESGSMPPPGVLQFSQANRDTFIAMLDSWWNSGRKLSANEAETESETEPTPTPTSSPNDDVTLPLTYEGQISAIVDQKCTGCHSNVVSLGGIDLSSWDAPSAGLTTNQKWTKAVTEVANGNMPPAGSPALTTEEKDAFLDWFAAGMPEDDESVPTDNPSPTPPPVVECDTSTIPDSAIKRLSNTQIKDTLLHYVGNAAFYRDMPALFSFVFALLPDDKALSGVEMGNAFEKVSPTHIEAHLALAKHLGKLMSTTTRWDRVYPECLVPDASPDDACLKSFISSWGMRMYKRPLDMTEIDRYVLIFRAYANTRLGVERLWTQWAFSPYFLYNLNDRSTVDPQDPTKYKLTPYERATQLSYALTGHGPDEELMAKAGDGSLATASVYNAEFDRLFMQRPEYLYDFTEEWLQLDGTGYGVKEPFEMSNGDPGDDPFYQRYDDVSNVYIQDTGMDYYEDHGKTPANRNNNVLMVYSNHIIANDGFQKYFTMPVNMLPLNWTDGAFMRFAQSITNGTYTMTDLPERRGILTHFSTNMQRQNHNYVNPIFKGIYVRENFLCTEMGEFPLDIGVAPSNTALAPRSTANKDKTTREMVDDLTSAPGCWACHKMWNGIGNAMGNYGSIGEYRTVERIYEENGTTVTKIAELPINTTDTIFLDGKEIVVNGIHGLQAELAASKTAQSCYVSRLLFQHMLGRKVRSSDQCFLEESRVKMISEGSIKEMVRSALTADQSKFKTVRP